MKRNLLIGTSLVAAVSATSLDARSFSVMTEEARRDNTALSSAIHMVTEGHKRATGKTPLKADGTDAFAAAYQAAVAKVTPGKDGKVTLADVTAALATNAELRKLVAEFRPAVVAAVAAEKKAVVAPVVVPGPGPLPAPVVVVPVAEEVSIEALTQVVTDTTTVLLAAIKAEGVAQKAVEDTTADVTAATKAKADADAALTDAEKASKKAAEDAASAKIAAETTASDLTALNADRKVKAETIAAAEKAIADKTAAGTAITAAETDALNVLRAELATIDAKIIAATTAKADAAAALVVADDLVKSTAQAVVKATEDQTDAAKAAEAAVKAKDAAVAALTAKTTAVTDAVSKLTAAKAAVIAAAEKAVTEATAQATAATEASGAAAVKSTELATIADAAKAKVIELGKRQTALNAELTTARAVDAANSTDTTKAVVAAKEAAVIAISTEIAQAKIAATHASQAEKAAVEAAATAATQATKATEAKAEADAALAEAKKAVKAAEDAVKAVKATFAQAAEKAKAEAKAAAAKANLVKADQAEAKAAAELIDLEARLVADPDNTTLQRAVADKKAELAQLKAAAEKAAVDAAQAAEAAEKAADDLVVAKKAAETAAEKATTLAKQLTEASARAEALARELSSAKRSLDTIEVTAAELRATADDLSATVDTFNADKVVANLIEETTAELAAAQARAQTPGATPDAIADAQIDIEIANATLLSAKTLADLMAQVIVEAGGEYSGKIADRMNADIAETKANFVKDFNSGKFVVAELVESYIQSFERFAEKAEQFNKLKTLFDIDTSVRIDTKTPAGRIIDARSQIVAQLQAVLTSSVSSKTVKEAETLLFAMTKRFTQFDRTLGRFAAARGRGFADAALEELVTLQRALNSAVDEEALSMRNLLAQLSQINEISAEFDQVSQLELAEKAMFDALDAAAKPAAQADYDRVMADFAERKAKLASDVSHIVSQPAGALRAGDDEAVEQRISYAPHAAAAAAVPADRVQNLTAEAIAALKKALKTYADFLTEISKATDVQLLSAETVNQLFGTLVAGSSSDYVAGSGKAGLDQFLKRLSRFIPLHIISDSTVGRFADEIRTTADAAASEKEALIAKMDVASAAYTTARGTATDDAKNALEYLIANVYERHHQIAQIEAEKAEIASQLFTAPDKDAIQAEIDARSRRIEEINQWLVDNKKAFENATAAAGDLVGLFEAVRELRKQIAAQEATADAEARTMEADFATLRRLDAEVKNARQAKAEESVRFVVAIAEAVQTILSPALAEVEDEEAEEEAEEGSEHGSVHSGGSTPRRPASGSFGKVTPPLRAGTTGVAFGSGSGSTGAAAAAAVLAPKPAGKTAAQQIEDEADEIGAL